MKNEKKLRLYCWGGKSMHDISGIMHALYDTNYLEKCIVECNTSFEKFTSDDVVTYINSVYNDSYSLEHVCDELPALGADLIKKMEPYQSIAISMGMRRHELPIIEYEREKERYFNELRFWNYILESNKINACFFVNVPHSQGAYIVYALARIKNIPIKFLVKTGAFRGRAIVASDIESIGMPIFDLYNRINKNEEIVLEGIYEDYYSCHTLNIDALHTKSDREVYIGNKKERKRQFNIHFSRWFGLKRIKNTPYIKYASRKCLEMSGDKRYVGISERKKRAIQTQKEEMALARFYKKYYLMKQSSYNKMAVTPVVGEKYIYFALQVTPEATTLPLAGFFLDQYTSIQLLARCANEFGLKVYVKEHPHSSFRSRHFYEEIENIPNVRMIKTTVSTIDLIENAVAVSTQTGTCILEAVLRKKPVFVFGKGYIWKGMPGVFEIEEEQMGISIMRQVFSENFLINQNEIKKYLYAFSNVAIEFYGMHARNSDEIENDIKVLKRVIGEMQKEI